MADSEYTKGFRNGRAYESKRIIKLLEDNLGNMDWAELVSLIEGAE